MEGVGTSLERRKLAFVLPRYFEGVAGGAETLASALARQLAGRGELVEIWTTCAVDNRVWANSVSPGESVEHGVLVRRFSVDDRDVDTWVRHQIAISEGMRLGVEEQLDWIANSVNSTGLYGHIQENAPEFRAVFFAPYLFGTTFFGALIHPENSVLIPCLHDEHYAYLEIIASLFRQVRGVLFNSSAEADLAQRLYGQVKGGEVGMGFEHHEPKEADCGDSVFEDCSRYVLYLGRKETGKGVQTLIDYFIHFKQSHPELDPVKLVVCGGGDFSDLNRAEALQRADIVDMSHASEDQKRRLIAGSEVLIQPSVNESFSIVLMEAWQQQRPVLVNGQCDVTRQHVLESGGGLYYSSYADFAGVLEEILSRQDLRSELGRQGAAYVARKYNWGAVLNRFDQVLSYVLDESLTN